MIHAKIKRSLEQKKEKQCFQNMSHKARAIQTLQLSHFNAHVSTLRNTKPGIC